MLYFVAMIFILGAVVMIPITRDAGASIEAQLDGRARGQELTLWHAAAMRACKSGCADGPIPAGDVGANLIGSYRGFGAFSDGTMRSFASGGFIYSYYQALTGSDAYTNTVYAEMMPAIMNYVPRDLSPSVGRYDNSSKTLLNASVVYTSYGDGPAIASQRAPTVIPVENAGGGVANGVPMIATESNCYVDVGNPYGEKCGLKPPLTAVGVPQVIAGAKGLALKAAITLTGGTAPFTAQLVSGSLIPGLSLSGLYVVGTPTTFNVIGNLMGPPTTVSNPARIAVTDAKGTTVMSNVFDFAVVLTPCPNLFGNPPCFQSAEAGYITQ